MEGSITPNEENKHYIYRISLRLVCSYGKDGKVNPHASVTWVVRGSQRGRPKLQTKSRMQNLIAHLLVTGGYACPVSGLNLYK